VGPDVLMCCGQVRQGQDLRKLALLFCQTHGLDPDTVSEPLLAHLQRNVGETGPAEVQGQGTGAMSGDNSSSSSSPSMPAMDADYELANTRRSLTDWRRPRSAMDLRTMEAFFRDLERERERRMNALLEDAKRHAARNNGDSSIRQQRRSQPRSAAERRDASKSPRALRSRAEAVLPRQDMDARTSSARVRGPDCPSVLRTWTSAHALAVWAPYEISALPTSTIAAPTWGFV
jgi:hypothetical protein